MCFDRKTSIIALSVNIITSLVLYASTTDVQLRVIALFFLFVGGMQFWDAIFWSFDRHTSVNKCATKAAMVWNHLEPIVLALLITNVMGKSLRPASRIILVLYTLTIVYYTWSSWSRLHGTGKTPESRDSLDWQWNHMGYASLVYSFFLLCLVVLFYDHFTGWVRWVSIFLTVSSFAFSMYKYSIKASVGRFWCYMAAFAPLIFLVLRACHDNIGRVKGA